MRIPHATPGVLCLVLLVPLVACADAVPTAVDDVAMDLGLDDAKVTPVLAIDPASIDFEYVAVGSMESQMFTLSNAGGAATASLGIALTGSAAYRIVSDGCGRRSLGKGESCTFTVEYAPTVLDVTDAGTITAQGKRTGTVTAALLGDALPDLLAIIGVATLPVTNVCDGLLGRTCESLAGNVITDALRLTHDTDFALINSGGIRASLSCPSPACAGPPGAFTRGTILAALPFRNHVVTLQVNGAELLGMLENSVAAMPASAGAFAQVSGLCFSYSVGASPGSRILGADRQAADGTCTGAPIDFSAAASYAIATIDFLAGGGDGYPVFTSRTTVHDHADRTVAAWIIANTPLSPAIQGRIVQAP